jgi:hypothetical protein
MCSFSTPIIAAALAAAAFNATAIWSSTIGEWTRSPEIADPETRVIARKAHADWSTHIRPQDVRPRRIRLERLSDAAKDVVRIDFSFGISLGGDARFNRELAAGRAEGIRRARLA